MVLHEMPQELIQINVRNLPVRMLLILLLIGRRRLVVLRRALVSRKHARRVFQS